MYQLLLFGLWVGNSGHKILPATPMVSVRKQLGLYKRALLYKKCTVYTVEVGNRHRPLDKNSKQTNKIQTAGYCCLLSISIRTIDNNSFSDVIFTMPTFLTRSKPSQYILGQPALLPLTCLPLEVDIYNAVIFTKNEMKL